MTRAEDMGLDCIKLIQDKMAHKMTPEEYYSALIKLDRKYPIPRRNQPLPKETLSNYRNLEIQPINFFESAEIYMRHKERVELNIQSFKPVKTVFIERSQPVETEDEAPF